jgi:integrase
MSYGGVAPCDPDVAVRIICWFPANDQIVLALAGLDKNPSGTCSTPAWSWPVRAILDRISSKQDGTLAAANTANRKRTVLNNLMTYAEVEHKLLPGNPLKSVTWSRPRKLKTVDPRCVINSGQARRFLDAVEHNGQRGKRLKAFFGCMY